MFLTSTEIYQSGLIQLGRKITPQESTGKRLEVEPLNQKRITVKTVPADMDIIKRTGATQMMDFVAVPNPIKLALN